VWLYGYPYNAAYLTQNGGGLWSQVVGYSGCFGAVVSIAGTYYYGCYDPSAGIEEFMPGSTMFTMLPHSPRSSSLTVTRQYLYASLQADTSGQPIYRAPLSDLTSWMNVATPTIAGGASTGNMQYDSAHQILYVAAWAGGLWRVSTP
jgi:hypothetical protein